MMERKCDTCRWKADIQCINMSALAAFAVMTDELKAGTQKTAAYFGCSEWEAAKRGTCEDCGYSSQLNNEFGTIVCHKLATDEYRKREPEWWCDEWQPKQEDGK